MWVAAMNRGLVRPLHDSVKVKHRIHCDTKILGTPDLWIPAKESCWQEWMQQKRRKCVVVSKSERTGEQKSPLISDMEMQSLEFALLSFGFALVQPFLTTPSFLPLGMEICFLWHCMLKQAIWVLLVYCVTLKRLTWLSEEILDFQIVLRLWKTMGTCAIWLS